MVLNAVFTNTVIDRDSADFDIIGHPGGGLDDETESVMQRFGRLLLQAVDAEGACRGVALEGAGGAEGREMYAGLCEQLHLERIQIVNTGEWWGG